LASTAPSTRTEFVDAARGVAMLLVFESHFGLMYFIRAGAWKAQKIASYIALPSAPIFVLLSGLVLGVLASDRGGKFPAQRLRLVDRGLFLLLPAHIVIRCAHYWVDRGLGPNTRWVFMTDAIGVCLVLVPWVVRRIDGWARVLLGCALLAFAWWIYLTWHPTSPQGEFAKTVLVGLENKDGAVFAFIPWMGAYVVATVAGERLSSWRRAGDPVVVRLFALGCACALPSAVVHVFSHRGGPLALRILSAGQKYPPGPSFLLGSAAIGCMILAALAWIEDRRLFPRAFAVLTLLGRTSLVVFVAQYFVYYIGFYLLALPMSPLWPLYFTVSVLINLGCSWLWDRYAGNRYLTVGLPRLIDAVRSAPNARPGVSSS
jgi:uncharacterized membrane protein